MKQIISLFSLLVVLALLMSCNKSTPYPNMQSNPQPANPYTEQGYIMTNLKKYDEAISYFNKAIQLAPQNGTSMFLCVSERAYKLLYHGR
jgi:tetratricopeptide (TPR) repeat protein